MGEAGASYQLVRVWPVLCAHLWGPCARPCASGEARDFCSEAVVTVWLFVRGLVHLLCTGQEFGIVCRSAEPWHTPRPSEESVRWRNR